jgi:hypothetical protein
MRIAKFALIAVAAVGLAFAAPVMAQPAPGAAPAPSVSPEMAAALKQAHAMADMLNVNQQVKGLLTAMRNQMVQATIQASGKSVEEAAKIVDDILMPDFNAAVPDLTEAMLQPWGTNFTAADLKTLQEFYSTPTGSKLLKNAPLVAREVQQATQAWGQNTFRAAVQKHGQELRDRGLKF